MCRKHAEKKLLRLIKHTAFAVISLFPVCKCVGPEEYIKIEMGFTLSADAWNFIMGLKTCAK